MSYIKDVYFVGFSGVGKTTIASAVAQITDRGFLCPHELIKYIALEKGFERIRDWNKKEGHTPIIHAATKKLSESINRSKRSVVVDDILSTKMLENLKFKNREVVLINVYVNEHERTKRLAQRYDCSEDMGKEEKIRLDEFKNNCRVKDVINIADFSVENNNLNDTIRSIISRLQC